MDQPRPPKTCTARSAASQAALAANSFAWAASRSASALQFVVARLGVAGVLGLGGSQHQGLRGQAVHLDGGDVLLHQLMLGDRLAVLLPFLGVADRLGQAILDHAQAAGGHAEPAADQRAHGDAEAVALLAEQVAGRHLDSRVISNMPVLAVGMPILAVRSSLREAGAVRVEDEGADPALAVPWDRRR